jgi:hypothetical protein
LGVNTGANAGTYSNSTAIGYSATITANNQIVLGTAAETVKILGGLNCATGLGYSQVSLGYYNYNTTGGSAQNITLPSSGVYVVMAGCNYGDSNISASFIIACFPNSHILCQYLPGWGYSVTGNGGGAGFTISASYPSYYNAFEIKYVRLS